MAQLSANTCNIITLFPLGAVCGSINASTNESFDGSIDVLITGGTAPYTITWSNGAQGSSLDNLQSGTYTATTVDFYGDFTATTVCTVGYDTYYLDVLESCSTPGSYIFYSSQTPSIFVQNSIYGIIGQSDCYTYTGRTLYTNQTVQSGFAQISAGPFVDCDDCLPDPPAPPSFSEYICLTKIEPLTQYTFITGATINGYPSYVETGSTTYVIYYEASNQRWELSGWTTGVPVQTGNMVQAFNSLTPTGTWYQLGTPFSWNVTNGICSFNPLTLSITTNDPSCAANNDGSILLNPTGGVPPYTFSLDGINYQSSALFSNLPAGPGQAVVKDSTGTIDVLSYVLVNSTTSQTYVVTINPSYSVPTNTTTLSTKSMSYSVGVSPVLGVGESLSFELVITDIKEVKTNGSQSPTVTSTISTPSVTSGTITSPNVATTTTGPVSRACGGQETSTATTRTYIVNLTGSGGVTGTIGSSVTTPLSTVASCPLYGRVNNQVSITNVILNTPLCNGVNTTVTPASLDNTKTGLISSTCPPSTYTHTKLNCQVGSTNCIRTTGQIKVNNVVQLVWYTATAAGVYNGSVNISSGDVVAINLGAVPPLALCVNNGIDFSDLSLVVRLGGPTGTIVYSASASSGGPNTTIEHSFVATACNYHFEILSSCS